MATGLVTYAQDIPLQDPANSQYDLLSLISDILNYAKSNLKSNAVVVPVLQSFNILIEGEALDSALGVPSGISRYEILRSRHHSNLKLAAKSSRSHPASDPKFSPLEERRTSA